MLVYNSSNNKIILDDAKVANNFISRTIGLIKKNNINNNEGLIIKPCCSIHTFFMKFNIDVIFVDSKNNVLSIFENVSPNHVLPINFKSAYVIEVKSQKISEKIKVSDILEIKN